jgi:putative aldouronate transport system substrate-binding protein
MKAHPTTDEGKKVYGISGWSDWPLWIYSAPFIYTEGWTENTKNTCTKPDGSYVHRYASDGPLWRGLEFFNKAYRAGILDPDLFTIKYTDYVSKVNAAQILAFPAGWMSDGANAYFQSKGETDKGYVAQVADGATSLANSLDSIVGQNDPWKFISKNCKYPERAMQLLNYLSTPEGSRLLYCGVQGVNWDNENGKPEMKDETIKDQINDKDFATKTGIGLYSKYAGLGGSYINTDGSYLNLFLNDKINKVKLTPLDADYSKFYGGTFPGDAWNQLVKSGKAKDLPTAYIPALSALQVQAGDDISLIESNLEQILIKETPKAVLAESEADFQAQKTRIMELLNKAGFDKVDAFWKQSYEDGLATYNKLIGK